MYAYLSRFAKFFLVVTLAIFLSGCVNQTQPVSSNLPERDTTSQSHQSKLVSVKYRSGQVNVGLTSFEYLPTNSSFVNGAWYDQSNKYMIIKLNSTYYHYCGLPLNAWGSFKKASSFGSHYNNNIKGNYDCRSGYVPSYK